MADVSMKCNQSDCANLGIQYKKWLAKVKEPDEIAPPDASDATIEICGLPHGTLYRCEKHFHEFDFLHQAVLRFEPRNTMDHTEFSPYAVKYIAI